MESTIYFESKRGNGYLYDMQNSSMVNCHPIVEELMKLPSDKIGVIYTVFFRRNFLQCR